MIAAQVRDTDLADYQRAVRLLLLHPLVTTTFPDRAALALVRRFSDQLAEDLGALAGYRLELAATCARLLRPVDRVDDTQRIVRRRDRAPFDRRRYAYLALVLAALGRAGTQVTLTELADALKRRAAEIDGLGFDPDQYRHRLAFVDVVRHLLELGGLREVEVSAIDWVRDPEAGEALYDLDRDVLHLVAVPPRVLQHVPSVRSLLSSDGRSDSADTSTAARRAATRRRLVRLLLEHPVVYLDDLDDAARTYLIQQGRVLADDLGRLTGGQLERRAEGSALIDATGGFSDRRFPSGGTAAQVALLLADAITAAVGAGDGTEVAAATVPHAEERTALACERLDAARPVPPGVVGDPSSWGERPVDGPSPSDPGTRERPPGPLFTRSWLEAAVEGLCATHGQRFAAALRDDPPALTTAALEVLASFDLVRAVPGGVVARPALARYRDLVVEVAPPSPAQGSLLDGFADDHAAARGAEQEPL
ncbi:MAG: TIGR02678 family protein [Nitriliruptoraceae bacterium]